jgi:AcrR family transcriptional regulator
VSKRRGPGEQAFVTRQQIVDAADALARRDGLEQLSIRKLSAELSVTPAALYWHLDNKQDLMREVVDRASARVERPDLDEGTWLDRLLLFFASTRQVFTEYSGITAAFVTLPPGEALQSNNLFIFQLLVEGGFDEDAAVSVFNAVTTYSLGHLMMIDTARANRRRAGEKAFTPNAAQLRQLHADRPEFAPFMRALADFDDRKSRQQFLDGIEVLVRGAADALGVTVPVSTRTPFAKSQRQSKSSRIRGS